MGLFSLFKKKEKSEISSHKEPTEQTEKIDFDAIMEKFNNRPILEVMTIEAIDSAEDDELIQMVFDNLTLKVENDYENSFSIISKLSKGRQAVYSIWLVEAEVNNGGFNQFYFNSSGEFSEKAVEGLELIGAAEHARLVRRANKIFIDEKLADRQDGTLEAFSESYEDNPLDDLDTEFYDMTENIHTLQIDFIRNNKEQFID